MVDSKSARAGKEDALPFAYKNVRAALDDGHKGRYSKAAVREAAWWVEVVLNEIGATAREMAREEGRRVVTEEDVVAARNKIVRRLLS